MKISIITPNYNYEKYLPELLKSVAMQNFQEIEHIIVDDGSTDDSVRVIEDFVHRYPHRFKLIQQANSGQSAALNTALKSVTGDLIIWINSDDYFTEGVFEKIADFFKCHPSVDILFGDINFVDLESNFIFRHCNQRFGYSEAALLGFTMFLSSNAVVWRSEIMEGVDGFNDHLKCNMDGEFYSRLFFNNTFEYMPLAISNFRKQPFSKAAENDDKWSLLMYRELDEELRANLKRIKLHTWPTFVLIVLKTIMRLKRAFIRLVSLRNYHKKIQLRQYHSRNY